MSWLDAARLVLCYLKTEPCEDSLESAAKVGEALQRWQRLLSTWCHRLAVWDSCWRSSPSSGQRGRTPCCRWLRTSFSSHCSWRSQPGHSAGSHLGCWRRSWIWHLVAHLDSFHRTQCSRSRCGPGIGCLVDQQWYRSSWWRSDHLGRRDRRRQSSQKAVPSLPSQAPRTGWKFLALLTRKARQKRYFG